MGETVPESALECDNGYCPGASGTHLPLALSRSDTESFGNNSQHKWLRTFQEHGYYLIDATDRPVNRLSPAELRSELKAALEGKLSEIRMLAPPGTPIVLVKKNIVAVFNRPLRAAGYNVIHESYLPFPSHGHQARFVEACRNCLARLEGDR